MPSLTRQGRDALYKCLKENKELFRYEESEFGEVEALLADYLSGKANFDQVLRASAGRASSQRQQVSRDQVGSVEQEIPDIIGGANPPAQSELDGPRPFCTRQPHQFCDTLRHKDCVWLTGGGAEPQASVSFIVRARLFGRSTVERHCHMRLSRVWSGSTIPTLRPWLTDRRPWIKCPAQ